MATSLGRFLIPPLICIAMVATWSCARETSQERVFAVRGVVQQHYDDRTGTLSIDHEAIPGYMPAMTMPFYADAAEARGLTPGDRVEFEFRVGERSRATKFRKIGRVELTSNRSERSSSEAPRRLRAGDSLPGFTLVDQDNQPLTEAMLREGPLIVTFIFTRCPVPEFCPLIGEKFQALQAALSKLEDPPAADARLLSVTIDPEHDEPAVLREYGAALGADFARWRFGTGAKEEIDRLTRLFAVRVENNRTSLDHTLATALIASDGTVIDIWRGNAWKPEEILTKLREHSHPRS